MSAHDNGGQAFPLGGVTTPSGEVVWPEYGMTLRDYFAAKALQGLLAEAFTPGTEATASVINESSSPDVASAAGHYARAAYKLADAMLKARAS